MTLRFQGRVWTVGDHIDTDMILPSRFLYETDVDALRGHLFEGLDPTLGQRIQPGDIFVAGGNFGCGSARPAPRAMHMCGVSCIVARTFSRTFLRSAIDTGVPILECDLTGKVSNGDVVTVDVGAAHVELPSGELVRGQAFPGFILDMIREGGVVPYTRNHLVS